MQHKLTSNSFYQLFVSGAPLRNTNFFPSNHPLPPPLPSIPFKISTKLSGFVRGKKIKPAFICFCGEVEDNELAVQSAPVKDFIQYTE